MSGDGAAGWQEPAALVDHLHDVTSAHVAHYGTAPGGVWSAPGRVNLIGEHVDYNGGPVLPIALEHRALVSLSLRTDRLVRLSSRQDPQVWEGDVDTLEPGRVHGWAGYAAGVLWALRRGGHELPGVDLLVDGRVPLGAGLSSSASLTCAVALAVAELADLVIPGGTHTDTGRRVLAQLCVTAENDFTGAPTGGMDQAVVMRARPGHAVLLDCSTFDAEHLPVPHDAEILVVDTRSHHSLVDGRYGGRRETCERAAHLLGVRDLAALDPDHLVQDLATLPDQELRAAVRHVVTEVQRVSDVVGRLRAGRMLEAGPTLLASHASLRDDFAVSTPELDLVVSSAVAAGAAGARMTGGGFGGSAVVLCRPGERRRVGDAVAVAAARAGYRAPGLFAVSAAGPAARVAQLA